MEMLMAIAVPLIGGLILFAIMNAGVRVPGTMMNQKFASIGELPGKRLSEITSVVGPPNSTSAAGDGKTVHQWMATGYHIVLVFDGDICIGINSETRV